MTPVRLEPAAPRSRVKHSTTEPLRSHIKGCVYDSYLLIRVRKRKKNIFLFLKQNICCGHVEVRGGPTLTTFFKLLRGSKYHYKQDIIRPPAKRYLNVVLLACRWWPNIECWLGCFVILHGIKTTIAKKPYIFVIFQAGDPPPPGSAYGGYSTVVLTYSCIYAPIIDYIWTFVLCAHNVSQQAVSSFRLVSDMVTFHMVGEKCYLRGFQWLIQLSKSIDSNH